MRASCKSRGDSFIARQKTSAMIKYEQEKGGAEEQQQLSPG